MENRTVKTGELYRHFKNKLYQVVTVAEHSETKEKLVIYQALYGDYRVYARPLDMFISEVDRVKYPKAAQKYRFERVEPKEIEKAQREEGACRLQSEPSAVDEPAANPKLLAFLEADTFEEKYNILAAMENEITDRLINDFSVVLDLVIPEGELEERYRQLKQCVAARSRYESTRLR